MAGTTTYYGISYPTSTDYVKDGAAAIQTVATGFDSAVAIPSYNAQTGTTYTFALTDVGKTVTASNAGAQTYTIPPTASVAWPTNATLYVVNLGAGVVTFAAGAGVTVTNTAQTLAQYQSARLVRTGLNAWTVTPDSGTSSGLTLVSSTTIGSAVSSVTVTGAFSAAYENYKIIVSGGVSSADCYLNIQLGASVTGYYTFMIYGASFASNTLSGNGSNNTVNFNVVGDGITSQGLFMNADFLNPFLAKYTRYGSAIGFQSATGSGVTSGIHKVATSYTDFTMAPSTGTITGGTIYVYGYNK